jgi:hypothetical protein
MFIKMPDLYPCFLQVITESSTWRSSSWSIQILSHQNVYPVLSIVLHVSLYSVDFIHLVSKELKGKIVVMLTFLT